MRRVRSQDRLQGFDPEPERTFHRRLREARDMNNIQALVQFPVDMAEEQLMVVQEVAMPSISNVTSSIVKPRITGHFELKQSMIQLLHANGQFMGLPHEDPQQHILNFLEISDTYITNGVTPDYVRFTLFPFSLLGEAKRWLKAEPANSITTWNDLAKKFLARFFPSGKTAKIRSEIVAFKQKAGESLYSTWERFKGLLRDCPHHNQTNEVLAHTFIEGLHFETKIVVDVATGGQVLEKSFDEIYALLNKFSKSNPDWQGDMGRHTVQKSAGVLELDVVSALSAQISTLTNQVNQMTMIINKQQAQSVKQVQIFSEVCGEGHVSNLCPSNPESVYFVGNANRGQTNQYGDTYNLNWRNHPNFSWGGNQGTQNQYRPQAPQQQYRPPQVEQQVSPTSHLEEILKKVMVEQQALSQKVMAGQQALATTVRNLEFQMGQLASAQNTRPAETLPSDTEPNPKAQVNAVTLRNGRALEEVPNKKKNTDHPEGELAPKPVKGNDKDDKGPKPVSETRLPPPFSQRLQKQKDDAKYKKFLDILSQVSVNLPLVEILQEVPKYAKYLRDTVANKRRHAEFETVELTEKV
ncbi:uncharacterized protein [Nicotiana sylvestris]|uniref:Uncharacterized protein LOC104222275 n=1 Tax=Nicotiana sylvestris TaxID=4096 RepID=A0A1U7WC41_NICSY|nr:PREDICTED: uncharacterized protein LOC104222275 [Nicotiana sylvestris]